MDGRNGAGTRRRTRVMGNRAGQWATGTLGQALERATQAGQPGQSPLQKLVLARNEIPDRRLVTHRNGCLYYPECGTADVFWFHGRSRDEQKRPVPERNIRVQAMQYKTTNLIHSGRHYGNCGNGCKGFMDGSSCLRERINAAVLHQIYYDQPSKSIPFPILFILFLLMNAPGLFRPIKRPHRFISGKNGSCPSQ